MDKILLKNMAFFGTHGVLQEEKVLGQKFFIDIELNIDLKPAGKTDDLTQTVSYAEVYDIVKNHAENKCYDLLEALGENICNSILKEYVDISEVIIEIIKPEAPVKAIFDFMGVSLKSNRDDIW